MDARATETFGGSNLTVDIVVLRQPVVLLPRRAALASPSLPDGRPNPKSGFARLGDFSVITELKVASTRHGGLNPAEVIRDFKKLSGILDAAERHYPANPLPVAYVGVLTNHAKRRFNVDSLKKKVAGLGLRSNVTLLGVPRVMPTRR